MEVFSSQRVISGHLGKYVRASGLAWALPLVVKHVRRFVLNGSQIRSWSAVGDIEAPVPTAEEHKRAVRLDTGVDGQHTPYDEPVISRLLDALGCAFDGSETSFEARSTLAVD